LRHCGELAAGELFVHAATKLSMTDTVGHEVIAVQSLPALAVAVAQVPAIGTFIALTGTQLVNRVNGEVAAIAGVQEATPAPITTVSAGHVVRIKSAVVPGVQVPLMATFGVLIVFVQVVLIWFGEPVVVVPTVHEATNVGAVGTVGLQVVICQLGELPLLGEHEFTGVSLLAGSVNIPGQVVVTKFGEVSPDDTHALEINCVILPVELQTIPSQLLLLEAT
jgi:hypothetical protein